MGRKIFRIISFILLIILTKEIFMITYTNFENKKSVSSYYINESSFNYNTEMIIDIPSINLETIVKKATDNFDNLDKNLVYYKNNDYNKTIIILGHSGLGYGTYFNRINELSFSDLLYLSVGNKKIEYKFSKNYEIKETYVDILNSNLNNTLLLITCKKNDNSKRLVVEYKVNSVQTLKI